MNCVSRTMALRAARRKLRDGHPQTRKEGADALAALPQKGAIRALGDPKSSVLQAAIGRSPL